MTIEGFRSYREPTTLDFTGMHRVCIIGPNGSGKSTVVTALLWAIFGKSRLRKNADLINSESDSATVELVFEVEGRRYRINRSLKKHSKNTSQKAFLYLESPDGDEQIADTIRAVDASISRILNMDYEDFVSASILLQGESDKFSVMSPADRKTLLAKILGLSLCEDIAKLARSRTREIEAEKMARRDEADRLESDLEPLLSAPEELDDATVRHAKARKAEEESRKKIEDARAEKAKFDARRREVLAVGERISARRREILSMETEMADAVLRSKSIEETIARKPEIEARLERLEAARRRLGQIERAATRTLEAEKEIVRLRAEIEAWRNKIAGEIGVLNAEIASMKRDMLKLDSLLDREPELIEAHREFVATKESLEKLREMADEAKAVLGGITKLRATISAEEGRHKKSIEELAERIDGLKKELTESDPRKLRETIESLDEEIARLENIERDVASCREKWHRINDKKTALSAESKQLDIERSENARKLELIRSSESSGCPLCGQALGDEHRERVIADFAGKIELCDERTARIAEEIERLSEKLSETEVKGKTLNEEKSRAGRLREKRAETTERLRAAEKCAAELRRVESKYAGIERKLHERLFCEKERSELKSFEKEYGKIAIDDGIIRASEKKVESLRKAEIEFENIPETRAEKKKLSAELDESILRRKNLKERLESSAEIETKLSKIAELDAAVDSAGYDREEHRAVEAEVAKLADAERRIREIEIAESTISEILRNVKNLEGKIDSAKADLDDLSKRRDELAAGLPQPGELEKLIESLEESRERLSADLREAAISLSQARSKLDELKKTKARKSEIERVLDEVAEREKLHRLLAEAMGKSGVPAFVISQALPEIEREADELLALLSGDEMSLKLSTFENRENLELRIADRNGERPYESYSGGESFRVDFALRVALSRFLAHRSGSELSMLIVDEGFGTQDTEGLALLIESLRAIESEFALILVITHIENLKGEFDQVVEVGKIPGTGSRIRTYV